MIMTVFPRKQLLSEEPRGTEKADLDSKRKIVNAPLMACKDCGSLDICHGIHRDRDRGVMAPRYT